MEASLVLYDEGCDACNTLASWIERRGVRVAPIGSAAGDTWLRDLDERGRYAAVHAVDGEGRRYTGGAAVPVVLSALPGGRPLARLARAWPRGTDACYRVLSRHRRVMSRVLDLAHTRSVSRR